ncbi:hypothetical protein V6N13_023157 [Hibiscus sabdariffa]
MGKVATTVQTLDIAQNLFYAYDYSSDAAIKNVPTKYVNFPKHESEGEDTLKVEASSKIIKDCLFDLNVTMKDEKTSICPEKEEVLMENIDEDEEERTSIKKF